MTNSNQTAVVDLFWWSSYYSNACMWQIINHTHFSLNYTHLQHFPGKKRAMSESHPKVSYSKSLLVLGWRLGRFCPHQLSSAITSSASSYCRATQELQNGGWIMEIGPSKPKCPTFCTRHFLWALTKKHAQKRSPQSSWTSPGYRTWTRRK